MKKDKILLVGLLVLLLILGGVMTFFAFQQEEKEMEKTDAIKIKEEYAKLNGQTNEKNQEAYPIVELNEKNPFVIATEEKIIDILENSSGIIYFGFAECPWCRSLLPSLEKVALEEKISNVYYLDVKSIRDVMELDDSNKPIVKEEGSKGYYKILELLEEHLEDYTLYTKDNKEVKTGEKRIFAPTVVAVSNGKVKKIHVGTVKTHKSGYEKLTSKETEELEKILKELIESIQESGTCTKEAC